MGGFILTIKNRIYTQEEYDRFYESLTLDFEDLSIKSEDQLKLLMQQYKYRVRTNPSTGKRYKDRPTDKQLFYAWNYLKDGVKGRAGDYEEKNK